MPSFGGDVKPSVPCLRTKTRILIERRRSCAGTVSKTKEAHSLGCGGVVGCPYVDTWFPLSHALVASNPRSIDLRFQDGLVESRVQQYDQPLNRIRPLSTGLIAA